MLHIKKGEARRELQIGDPIDTAVRDVRAVSLDAIQELRIGEQSRDALLDSTLEVLALAADLIELHQRVDGGIVLGRAGAGTRAWRGA